MIDDKQIRAARAILDWSQEKLAEASGVARATIKNVENRSTLPRMETYSSIRKAFEQAGIEFLPSSGVRLRDRMVVTHEGEGANRELVKDVYETLRDTGGELLIAFLDESRAIKTLGEDYLYEQSERRRAVNITHRLLIHQNEKHIFTPLTMYRIVPDEHFSEHPLFIYGSKLALLSTDSAPRVVILEDERFADTARKLFNFIWDRTEMPSVKQRAIL